MAPTNPDTLRERVDFRLSPEVAERLRTIAREEETSLGAILRRAVRIFLASLSGPPSPTP